MRNQVKYIPNMIDFLKLNEWRGFYRENEVVLSNWTMCHICVTSIDGLRP